MRTITGVSSIPDRIRNCRVGLRDFEDSSRFLENPDQYPNIRLSKRGISPRIKADLKSFAGDQFFKQQPHISASLSSIYPELRHSPERDELDAYQVLQPCQFKDLTQAEHQMVQSSHLAKHHVFIARRKNETGPDDYNIHVKGMRAYHPADLVRSYRTARNKQNPHFARSKALARLIASRMPENSNVVVTGHSQGAEDAIVIHHDLRETGRFSSLETTSPVVYAPKLSAAAEKIPLSEKCVAVDFHLDEKPRRSLTRFMETAGYRHPNMLVVNVPLESTDSYGYVCRKRKRDIFRTLLGGERRYVEEGFRKRKFKLDPLWKYHGNDQCFPALVQASERAFSDLSDINAPTKPR